LRRAGASTRRPTSSTAIGSKAAVVDLPAALINPGDVAIMTVPGYPVFGTHTKWYGGEVFT